MPPEWEAEDDEEDEDYADNDMDDFEDDYDDDGDDDFEDDDEAELSVNGDVDPTAMVTLHPGGEVAPVPAAAPQAPAKNAAREDQAATTLQSKTRQRAAKKEVAKVRKEKHGAATKLQSMQRRKAAQKRVKDAREEKRVKDAREEKRVKDAREEDLAAVKLQSLSRQRDARRRVAHVRLEKESANKIQARMRGKFARQQLAEEKQAATAIQARQRGRVSRKQSMNMRSARSKENAQAKQPSVPHEMDATQLLADDDGDDDGFGATQAMADSGYSAFDEDDGGGVFGLTNLGEEESVHVISPKKSYRSPQAQTAEAAKAKKEGGELCTEALIHVDVASVPGTLTMVPSVSMLTEDMPGFEKKKKSESRVISWEEHAQHQYYKSRATTSVDALPNVPFQRTAVYEDEMTYNVTCNMAADIVDGIVNRSLRAVERRERRIARSSKKEEYSVVIEKLAIIKDRKAVAKQAAQTVMLNEEYSAAKVKQVEVRVARDAALKVAQVAREKSINVMVTKLEHAEKRIQRLTGKRAEQAKLIEAAPAIKMEKKIILPELVRAKGTVSAANSNSVILGKNVNPDLLPKGHSLTYRPVPPSKNSAAADKNSGGRGNQLDRLYQIRSTGKSVTVCVGTRRPLKDVLYNGDEQEERPALIPQPPSKPKWRSSDPEARSAKQQSMPEPMYVDEEGVKQWVPPPLVPDEKKDDDEAAAEEGGEKDGDKTDAANDPAVNDADKDNTDEAAANQDDIANDPAVDDKTDEAAANQDDAANDQAADASNSDKS